MELFKNLEQYVLKGSEGLLKALLALASSPAKDPPLPPISFVTETALTFFQWHILH